MADYALCLDDCNNKKCRRHTDNHIHDPNRDYQDFAYLAGTEVCEKESEVGDGENND